jgi:hypothetical protein
VIRLLASVLVLALLFGGFEYATDYVEAFEGTPLAVLADGHAPDDGHAPAEHSAACDGCHFGGVHPAALLLQPATVMPAADVMPAPWRSRLVAAVAAIPPYRPPIA